MGSFNNNDIIFNYNGYDIKPNDVMSTVVSAIGNASNVESAPSCIGVGEDKIYFYGGFSIETYPESSGEKILHVAITDSSAATVKNVTVGMTTADIEKAYGTNNLTKDEYIYTYTGSGNTHLDFLVENGVIIEIDYVYDVT